MKGYLELLAQVECLESGNRAGEALTKLTKASSVSFVSAPPKPSGDEGQALPEASEDRHAGSVELCHRLAARIAHQSPPGLGRWDPAWEIVEAPSKRLLDALADWERSGADADQRAALRAAEAVVIAWERAATAWSKGWTRPDAPFQNQ